MNERILLKLGNALALAAGLVLSLAGCGKEGRKETSGAESPRPTKPPLKDTTARMQWNMDTLVGSYLSKGHRDPSWDEVATNALAIFAQIRSEGTSVDENQSTLLETLSQTAVDNGCEDPMILYLHTRFNVANRKGTTDEIMAQAYRRSAAALSQYPSAWIRQFYICLRTSAALDAAAGENPSPEGHQFRRTSLLRLQRALDEPDIPTIEAYEACRELLESLERWPNHYPEYFQALEPILKERWPKKPFVHQFKGEFELAEAWRSRGSGYADTVSEDGWKQFAAHLAHAAESFEKAWKLSPNDPEIAVSMIQVELGEGKGRARMELWFDRAMRLDRNNYNACDQKRNYLEPKWHGSPEEMLAFGRECVASDQWKGRVPLVLVDAHDSLAGYAKRAGVSNYWQQAQVWTDVSSAFEKFFSLNPDAVGWRHNYANYAFMCENWEAFNRQVTLFGDHTNHSYFGGQKTFDQMIQTARGKAARPAKN